MIILVIKLLITNKRINSKPKANQQANQQAKCLKPTICRLLLSRLLPQQIRLMVLKEIIQVYNTLHRVSKIFITLKI